MGQTGSHVSGILTVQHITSEEDFIALADQWNALVKEADLHVFQSFEWLHTWWMTFGNSNQLYTFAVWDDKKLVGLLPMFKDKVQFMGKTLSVSLRMLGSHVRQPDGGSLPVKLPFGDYLAPIVHPRYKESVFGKFRQLLLDHNEEVDETIFEELPETTLLNKEIAQWGTEHNWKMTKQEASACPIIQLPDSWDELLANLSSNARYQIRRDFRKLTEEKIFEFKGPKDKQEVKQVFGKLVEFHQKRWNRRGRPGVFADPRILDFYKKIVLKFFEKGWLHLKYLEAEGECIAVDLLYKFNGVVYLIQRGFDVDSKFSDYGPGNILLYAVIKEAIENKVEAYDFLRGVDSYKMRMANSTLQNYNYRLYPENNTDSPLLNKYVQWCRKFSNERHIIGLHFKRHSPLTATTLYARRLSDRLKDRF